MTSVTVDNDGFVLESQNMGTAIDDEVRRQRYFKDLDEPGVLNCAPPVADPVMFYGVLGDLVKLCCTHSEAVPVAVASYALAYFSAYLGPTKYLSIADERRLLNNYWLLIGPSGMGKGSSVYGVERIFKMVDENMQQVFSDMVRRGQTSGIVEYPSLDIHAGGLSSGEGLVTAKADSVKLEKGEPAIEVTDKRFLLIESEFGNVLNMAERSGNTLSHTLRNGYDGKTIKPLTKRDRVSCSQPYFVLVGNITPGELNSHKQNAVMSVNGMLNRMMLVWTRTDVRYSRPKAIDDRALSDIASRIAKNLLSARSHNFETHWRKQWQIASPIGMTDDAWQFWDDVYPQLVNMPDCEPVQTLCRRHRLHIRIIAGLLALMNGEPVIGVQALRAALAWSDFSRQSVVYACKYFSQQDLSQRHQYIGLGILRAVHDASGRCTMTKIYSWFNNKIRRDEVHAGLESCLSFIPPLLKIEKIKGKRGRPVSYLILTTEGRNILSR